MNTILHFVNYCPRIYSALDRFLVLVAKEQVKQGFKPYFVYCDNLQQVPSIQRDIEEAGGGILFIPSQGKRAQIKAVWQLYKQYRPQKVYINFILFLKLVTALFSKLFGAQHFDWEHSLYWSKTRSYGLRSLWTGARLGWIGCLSKQVLCVSQSIHDQFATLSWAGQKKAKTFYLGVATAPQMGEKRALRTELGLPQDAFLLCNVSAKEPIKGIDLSLEMLALLLQKESDRPVYFCHIGGLRGNTEAQRNYEQWLYQRADELGVSHSVFWLGRRMDVSRILPAFDIYVQPSRSEGLGNVLQEAAVAGLPLVAARVGGMPEVVEHGVTGFLFESENVADFAACVEHLLNDSALRFRLGKAARESVCERFNVERQAQRVP